MPKRFTIGFATNRAGFCLRAGGLYPFVVTRIARCLATYATGFGGRAGGINPLVDERVPIGVAAYATGFRHRAGSLLPFVVMQGYDTARMEQDTAEQEIQNAT